MYGATNAEFYFTTGEVPGYLVGVRDGSGQAVELGNHERVSGPARGHGHGFAKSCAILVSAVRAMIKIDSFRLNTKGSQVLRLN
ncbi:hypothetical protein BJ956_001458 [Arthrobacter psychrochitiniphilus]|nr:hypothetical protein [Arthrobacter psychrochitiniphilus]